MFIGCGMEWGRGVGHVTPIYIILQELERGALNVTAAEKTESSEYS